MILIQIHMSYIKFKQKFKWEKEGNWGKIMESFSFYQTVFTLPFL